jgi:AraC family transcriptional regulator of adaptative response/methylated-DNA-[protein]-cysteine methyltransferase
MGPRRGRLRYRTEAERWQALVDRDSGADGSFCYSVQTTGVNSRPSCPARLPRREHVSFHRTPAEAEAAGYRPCQRCQPNRAPGGKHPAWVEQACRLIEASDPAPGLDVLARPFGLSRFQLQRTFKAVVGISPKAYAAAVRAKRLRAALDRRRSVTEAIYEAGFGSNSRFYEKSAELLGMQPRTFQRGGAGVVIRFAVGECSLGSVLVAASERGICAILLGDDPGRLINELQDRFPNAELIGSDRQFERTVGRVVGLIENPGEGLELPLDIRGTAFQRRVWEALRQVPPGRTLSYTQLARRVGRPGAVRAVAKACAANPLAVAIPCHRVVRLDGSLSGYRWGMARKRALLAKERRRAEPASRK